MCVPSAVLHRCTSGTTLAACTPAHSPAAAREFCVLNAFHDRSRTFVSKSVRHASMPGSSPYADGGPPPGGRIRALNTFAMRTTPAAAGAATLELINYADLVGTPTMMNWVNVQLFLPGLVERLRERVARG